jgi:hypothetical protein
MPLAVIVLPLSTSFAAQIGRSIRTRFAELMRIPVRRYLVWIAGDLKQIAAQTPAHHQAETKQQRFFEPKDSKVSKVFGSVLKGSALCECSIS